MSHAIYPGSFDPITNGHLDIIERAQKLFPVLTVLVASSPTKKYMFNLEERVKLLKESLNSSQGIKVEAYDGLTIDYAASIGAQVIVRGVRAFQDFEFEMSMAQVNKKLNTNIETMIFFASPENHFVGSRWVKEVGIYGGDISQFVPVNVEKALKLKFS